MPKWLIEESAMMAMQSTLQTHSIDSVSNVGGPIAGSAIVRHGSTAVIHVNGILTPKPDSWLAKYFGNTAYSEIISAIYEANQDQRVSSIEMIVGSSPGGSVEGLIPAMDAIRNSGKPVTAIVDDAAHSAAYGLISQAQGGIYASHRATMFGSVGVAVSAYLDGSVVSITNRESKNKRPDIATPEGRAVVEDELDEVFGIFADTIAQGRRMPLDSVISGFGRGASFPADKAISARMIDGYVSAQAAEPKAKEAEKMDLAKMKADHPELVAAIQEEARNAERGRVVAHLTLADASGAMPRAIEDIKAGNGLNETVKAFHMAEGIKAARNKDRVADNSAANLGTTQAPTAEKTPEDIFDEKLAARLGAYFEGGK